MPPRREAGASLDHRLPKIGAAISIFLAALAALTFAFLNQRFEGPDPFGFLGSPYELTARFDNSKTLPSKQAVLHKGVSIGRVNKVVFDNETQEAVATFTIDGDFGPIYEDAIVQIGERSLLGDAYLNLVDRGSEQAGELEAGEEVGKTLTSVNFDEALDFLDEEGRARVRSLIDTVAEGASPPGNGYRLNSTVGGVSRAVHELRGLTDALRGQEEDIASLVSNAAIVLDELGAREDAIRMIVSSGRATLDALASNTDSLDQAMVELPRLLETGTATLAELRPLAIEARPLVSDLRDLAPDLVPAFDEGAPFSIGPLSTDLIDIIEGLEPQRIASEQVLPRLADFNRTALPVTEQAVPATLNTVPIADYLAPRSNSFGAFYALGASAAGHHDEVGGYARFAFILEPLLLADARTTLDCAANPAGEVIVGGFCSNAYPDPNDSLDHQPYSGEYPRLLPYEPPSRRSVLNGP